jgi:hypothetical protein
MNQPDSDEEDKKKKKDKGKKSYFKVERGFLVNKIMKLASSHYNMIDKENNVSKFKYDFIYLEKEFLRAFS